METHDFIYDGVEYTLVDIYDEEKRKLLQLNSDDDVLLLLLENGKVRKLTQEEEKEYREKYGLVELNYVTATPKDLYNFEFSARKIDKKEEQRFKEFFKSRLYGIDPALVESPYITKRLNALRYRYYGRSNSYASNLVYVRSESKWLGNGWIPTHETVHGIVNKSSLTTYAMIEGITDMMVGMMLPNGSYSRHYYTADGTILINNVGMGQEHIVTFAKQMRFALGEEFDIHEMFAHPHKQIKKFGQMYGRSKCRVLLHKINKVYRTIGLKEFLDAQEYMLEMVFDKKLENVHDEESAKKYFEELIEFGLLRGRIKGKDEALEKYYKKQQEVLKSRGIDLSNIPSYSEKPFSPCGDVYFRYDSYIESSIRGRKEGKGTRFQIFYNKDNTCVYIIIDGKLNYIDSAVQERKFFEKDMNEGNTKVVQLDEERYLITGPDGITEEVRDTYADEIIDEYFEKQERRNNKTR